MRLLSFLNRKIRQASSLIFKMGAMEVYSPIDNQKAIDEGYNANTAVYSIVMLDAEMQLRSKKRRISNLKVN
jgi:hypothetical protein